VNVLGEYISVCNIINVNGSNIKRKGKTIVCVRQLDVVFFYGILIVVQVVF